MPKSLPAAAVAVATYVFALWSAISVWAFSANLNHSFPGISWLFPFAVDGATHKWYDQLNLIAHKATDSTHIPALAFDAFLWIGVFMLPHSYLARPSAKASLRSLIPESLDRTFYLLHSSLFTTLVLSLWRPVTAPVAWDLPSWAHPWAYALQAAAFAFVLTATFARGHLEAFGLVPTVVDGEAAAAGPATRWHYALMRHPIAFGATLALLAQPRMTAGHLLFSLSSAAYMVAAPLLFAEPRLAQAYGDRWTQYAESVPPLPGLPKSAGATTAAKSAGGAADVAPAHGAAAAKTKVT